MSSAPWSTKGFAVSLNDNDFAMIVNDTLPLAQQNQKVTMSLLRSYVQSPWQQEIDANGEILKGLSKITFSSSGDLVTNETSIREDGSENLFFNLGDNTDDFTFAFGGSIKYTFTMTTLTAPNITINQSLLLADATSNPTANGEFRRVGADVRVFTGGSLLSFADIVTLSATQTLVNKTLDQTGTITFKNQSLGANPALLALSLASTKTLSLDGEFAITQTSTTTTASTLVIRKDGLGSFVEISEDDFTPDIFIIDSSRRVGIGTTTPTGKLTVEESDVAVNLNVEVQHSGTAAGLGRDAMLTLQTGGSTGGDPFLVWAIKDSGTGFFAMGIDNDDGDVLKIRGGTDIVGVSIMRFGRSGGPQIGFYDTTPKTQFTITGVREANTALTGLLAALDALGLIKDMTSNN